MARGLANCAIVVFQGGSGPWTLDVRALSTCYRMLFVCLIIISATGLKKAVAAEFLVGSTAPYSGPASGYSTIGKGFSAYFDMLNSEGGIQGRTIRSISYDDAYSPPKTVEQVRRLVENDDVEVLLGLFGTPTNAAVQKYINAKKIP